jgi:hypothetical protein
MKLALHLGLCTFLLTVPAGAQTLRRVRIDVPDAQALAQELEEEGFDVVEGSVLQGSLELVVSDPSMSQLLARGYMPEVLEIGRPFAEIQAERDAAAGPDLPPPAGYLDLASVYADMQATAAAFPSICKFVDLTATYGTPTTWEGRSLFALKISDNVNVDEDEPATLVVADHHAREITTPVACLYAIDQFTQGYGTNPTLTQLVDSNEIWIAPIWNPDGYNYVFTTNNLWRKNRHVFPGGVGVDLNRNYPFGWTSSCAGSTNPNSDTYKGPSAGSEAETITMMAWAQEERFAKLIDYHSFGREVLYEYLCQNHPLVNFLAAEALILSQMSNYGATRAPSAAGEHYEWQLATFGNHAFLIEIDTQFQPSLAQANTEAARIFPGQTWLLGRPISVTGTVTDIQTGLPVQANLSFKAITYVNGETNTSDPDTGRYYAFLPNGTQTVTFSAPGYRSQSAAVFVSSTASQVANVQLVPTGFCPTATVFNRTRGANANVYSVTAPRVGQSVTFTVSNTQGFAFATILGFGSPGMRPLDGSWALIDPESALIFKFGPLAGPTVSTSQVVAPSSSMCGMYIYSQVKLHNASGPFGLTNAQDLLIGN